MHATARHGAAILGACASEPPQTSWKGSAASLKANTNHSSTSPHLYLWMVLAAGVPLPADPEDPAQADKARNTKKEKFGLLMTPAPNAKRE